jgi:hypothetical protein
MENLNKPPVQYEKPKSKKKIILIFLFVVGIIISAYIISMQNIKKIGQNKIDPIINTFIANVASNNEQGEYEMYSSEVKKDFSLEDLKNTPEKIKSSFDDIKSVKATEYSLLDDRGQKYFTYTGIVLYNDGAKRSLRVELIYENNNWKIKTFKFSIKTY